MLGLTDDQILKSGGDVEKRFKKQSSIDSVETFCKTYQTSPDVIKYYNDPNYCLKCNKKISANSLVTYQKMKEQIFCSDKCKDKYFSSHLDGKTLIERSIIHFTLQAINAAREKDMTLMDWFVKEIDKNLLHLTHVIDDEEKK